MIRPVERMNKKVVCPYCYTEYYYDDSDVFRNSVYLKCCDVDVEVRHDIVFPDSFHSFKDATKVDNATINKWVKTVENNLDTTDYAYCGSGDTMVFGYVNDGDKSIFVAKNYYEY